MDISEGIKIAFTKIKPWQAWLLALLAVFLFWGLKPTIDYIDNRDVRAEERYRMEYRVRQQEKKTADSLETVRKIEEVNLFVFKNNRIHDLLAYLERRIPNASHISISALHNHGAQPRTSSEAEYTILYSQDNVKGVDMMTKFKNFPNYAGYAELSYQLLKAQGQIYYMSDVREYPAVYVDKTAETMRELNTMSLAGCWIKTADDALYFIIVSFDGINGMEMGGKGAKEALLLSARNELIDLIDTDTLSWESDED